MFRTATSRALKRTLTTRAGGKRGTIGSRTVLATGTGGLAATAAYAFGGPTTHADAPNFYGNLKEAMTNVEEQIEGVSASSGVDWLRKAVDPEEELISLVWGSNKFNALAPDTPGDNVRSPSSAEWLRGVALRDLALAETYGACVDAQGDVYQWGSAFPSPAAGPWKAMLVLKGKDIVAVTTTPTKAFALSSSGTVYVLSSTPPPASTTQASSSSWTSYLFGSSGPSAPSLTIVPSLKLARSEKIVQLTSGTNHLLALTSTGRVLAHAVSPLANDCGQLGTRRVPSEDGKTEVALEPRPLRVRGQVAADPTWATLGAVAAGVVEAVTPAPATLSTEPTGSPGAFLVEVPAFQGVQIAQVSAGGRSSFARTADGRVLAWGANERGQLGLGGPLSLEVVPRPTEVVFAGKGRAACTDIAAGGDLALFTVERTGALSTGTGGREVNVEVLACGNGQFGGLGGATFSNAQGTPTRVRKVSGLREWSDAEGALAPLRPHALSVGPTGHVLLTLDTLATAAPAADGGRRAREEGVVSMLGRDLMVWGSNSAGELGGGRRGSVAVPTGVLNSRGGHFMLTERAKVDVRGLDGRSVGRRKVEQCAVAGWASSAVYWRVVS